MKKTNLIYWIFTGLFSAFMLLTAIPDVLNSPDAAAFMTGQLGYPAYFTPFIGVAKVLGAIAILIPGFPRIKEWAYAGLVFDLIGAMYSVISIGAGAGAAFIALPLVMGIVSYIYHHKRLKESAASN